LAKTGHQDTVMQLMLGGMTQKKIVALLEDDCHHGKTSSIVGLTSRL
jgi:hypothetical protein